MRSLGGRGKGRPRAAVQHALLCSLDTQPITHTRFDLPKMRLDPCGPDLPPYTTRLPCPGAHALHNHDPRCRLGELGQPCTACPLAPSHPPPHMLMLTPASPPAPAAASNRVARRAAPSLADLKVALLVERRRRRRGLRVSALAVAAALGAGLRALLPPACAPPPPGTGCAPRKEPQSRRVAQTALRGALGRGPNTDAPGGSRGGRCMVVAAEPQTEVREKQAQAPTVFLTPHTPTPLTSAGRATSPTASAPRRRSLSSCYPARAEHPALRQQHAWCRKPGAGFLDRRAPSSEKAGVARADACAPA